MPFDDAKSRALQHMVLGGLLLAAIGQPVAPIAAQSLTAEPTVSGPTVPVKMQDEDWQRFPLMLINLTPADVPNVADLVDVVSYYTTFAPFEALNAVTQAEADNLSFRLGIRAEPMINAAEAAGLHLNITPALLAHPDATEVGAAANLIGDGLLHDEALYVNPAVVPGCTDGSEAACIQVPVNFGQITPEYIDYWAGKLPNFFQAVDAADPTGRVWGIYGAEEIRPWYNLEYAAQQRLREVIDNDPAMAGRPLMAYSAHNRMPGQLAATLLAEDQISGAVGSFAVNTTPAIPRSFLPQWTPNVPPCLGIGPGCDVLGFNNYYPLQQDFATDAAGDLMPIQDHVMRGSYLGYLMGANGHVNRIASIHRMDAQIEALSHVRNAYFTNGQPVPSPLAFHLPDLNLCSLAEADISAAEARHDFWSGLHRGRGVFIYNYQFVVQAQAGFFNVDCPFPPTPAQVLTVWDEYEIGLRLIKSSLREYILDGVRTFSVPFTNVNADVLEIIPGTDYLIDNPIPGADATFAMPDYPALRGSAYRLGSKVYLIVTHSYAQQIEFTVPFSDRICGVSVAHGDDGSVSFVDNELSDSFSGIEGRVYQLGLVEGGGCP
ncbi:MAG: hypothetical protein AAF657_09390 [Acidobacteriota bacterium]